MTRGPRSASRELFAPPIAAVGHKAYLSHARTLEWFAGLRELIESGRANGVSVILVPPATALAVLQPQAAELGVVLGAQDCSAVAPGPWTGELPAALLREVGAQVMEIGHAERRRMFGDTDQVVARKVLAAVGAGAVPIVCAGEAARVTAESAAAQVIDQLSAAVAMIGRQVPIIVGYEPVWAIGAPRPAPGAYVVDVVRRVREWLDERSPGSRIIYGGAAGPGSFAELDGVVDGLFLGRRVHEIDGLSAVLDELRSEVG